MDERRARIHDDLRGVVEGELLFEPLERAPYAHDASLYEIDPLGVIVPRTEDDVVTVVRYAAENGSPLHARGAGTGPGGGALGPGAGDRLQPPLPPGRRRSAGDAWSSAGGGARRPERPARPAGPAARAGPGDAEHRHASAG